LGLFIESLDDSAPRLVLAVVDLTQIQYLALHHFAARAQRLLSTMFQ